jgi:hypothetical protein
MRPVVCSQSAQDEQSVSGAAAAVKRQPSQHRATGNRPGRRCSGRLTRASASLSGNERRPARARRCSPQTDRSRHQALFITPMRRGRLPARPADTVQGAEGQKDSPAAKRLPSAITPSNILSPAPEPTRGSWIEVRLGARAQRDPPTRSRPAPNRPTTSSRSVSNPSDRGPKFRQSEKDRLTPFAVLYSITV